MDLQLVADIGAMRIDRFTGHAQSSFAISLLRFLLARFDRKIVPFLRREQVESGRLPEQTVRPAGSSSRDRSSSKGSHSADPLPPPLRHVQELRVRCSPSAGSP